MAIDPLSTWKSELANLPKVADTSWAANFANYYADRIVNITTDPSALVPSGFVFTFAKPVFQSQLLALTPTNSALAGITGFANAWEAAILASTVVVAPGSFKPPTSPTTLFSVVISTIIVPTSIAAGKAKIIELVSAPPVEDAMDSQFPVKFRDATLELKITVTGLDSQPIPPGGPGPQPLVVANIPLI
jgi:hypothetical protein